MSDEALFSGGSQAKGGLRRARALIRAAASSDVKRAREIALATLGAGIALALALFFFGAPTSLRTPGPLARPHQAAHIACGSCHADRGDGKGAAGACTTCHGQAAHPSTRPAHRALAAAGKLGCVSCHPAHGAGEGVTFLGQKRFVRWGDGDDVEGTLKNGDAPKGATVPLLPLTTCTRCHDPAGASDPLRVCLTASGSSGCFDEHQRVDRLGAPGAAVCARQHVPSRFVAWDAAREVAATTPSVREFHAAPMVWAFSPFAGASLMLVGTRVFRRFRRAPAKKTTPLAAAARVRLPQIDTNTCLGCYACVDACPFDVLEIEKYVAVVARPADCCGVVLCEQACPNGSLVITEGAPIETRPRVDGSLESLDAPGIFLAGDLTGLPLIKNAIGQGKRAIDRVAESISARDRVRGDGKNVDVVIIGAGPAGISASLRARELGLSYVTLEQATVAASIKSFPRDKLIFDQPLDLPVEGELWMRESSKEELLVQWARIVRARKLAISEHHRVTDIVRQGGRYAVTALARQNEELTFGATRVVLAIGRRGTPRPLDAEIDAAAETSVSYALADARSFADKNVLIVGLGDSAMEAAVAIARQPGTTVTVSYRGKDFARGKARNIAELKSLVARGRITLIFESEVRRVEVGRATLVVRGEKRIVSTDGIIVLIGGVASSDLLIRAGVKF